MAIGFSEPDIILSIHDKKSNAQILYITLSLIMYHISIYI